MRDFISLHFPDQSYPQWVVDALASVSIVLPSPTPKRSAQPAQPESVEAASEDTLGADASAQLDAVIASIATASLEVPSKHS